MGIKRALRNALGDDTTRRCVQCGLSFDREPLNCPACGSPNIE